VIGQNLTVGTDRLGITAAAPLAPSIRIPGEANRALVTIHPDGRLEFGEAYEPPDGEPYKSYLGHTVYPTQDRVYLTKAGRDHYEKHVRSAAAGLRCNARAIGDQHSDPHQRHRAPSGPGPRTQP
jgi:hypothetical protein